MGLRVFSSVVPPLDVNAYVVSDEATGDAVVIDPGDFSHAIERHIASNRLKVHCILLTHGHFDHTTGVAHAVRATGAPVVCHALTAPMLADPILNGAEFFDTNYEPVTADRTVEGGETLRAGALEIAVLHTPGHTRGDTCYRIGGELFSGDVLFNGGIGRTDLPGGDHQTLLRSIRERLFTLPGTTRVHPGHGQPTTIDRERRTNPFLNE